MKKRTFDSFNTDELDELFGLRRVKQLPVLQQWITASHPAEADYAARIVRLQSLLTDNADAWNEDELKIFFIGPFINEAELHTDNFKPFTQRAMSISLPEKEIEMLGKVEFMLAQGRINPKKPFFFLHEYKQERRRETDPLAQVLIAMLAARAYNQHDYPDYGCYVVGRLWFFVIAIGNEYAVSPSYDATNKDEIFQIFSILREVKNIAIDIFSSK